VLFCPFVCLCVHLLSIYLFVCLSVHLFVYLSICSSICLSNNLVRMCLGTLPPTLVHQDFQAFSLLSIHKIREHPLWHFLILKSINYVWDWFELQWAPLNGITDNVITIITESLLRSFCQSHQQGIWFVHWKTKFG
jgi:hypothetical protein